MKRFRLLVGIAVLLVAAGAGYFFLSEPRVGMVSAERRDLVQSVVASGRVAAPHRVDVGSQIVGNVVAIPVEEGQTVKVGQVLIRLDDGEARANLRQAEATLGNARAQYERNRKLADAGFVGKSALDDTQRALDVGVAQLEAARVRLGYATITAPRAGVLIGRDVERGDVVQPGKTLMVLSPAGEVQIVLQIDERNLSRLRLGQKALASADAYAQERFAAEVVYINPGVDAQRGTVEVKLRVPQPPAYLRQDMTVSVDIEVARSAATLVLPVEAVRDADGSSPWVVLVRDGRAVRRPVRLGLRGNGVVEIREGLEAGVLVAANAARLTEGQRVRAAAHE